MSGTAPVTGASRGLGAAIARRLAADGRPVAYHSGAEQAEQVVEQIVLDGGTAKAFSADVTTRPSPACWSGSGDGSARSRCW